MSIFNFLAVIPLSALVSAASERLSEGVGDVSASLINATFGNCVELTVRSFLALFMKVMSIGQQKLIYFLLYLGWHYSSCQWTYRNRPIGHDRKHSIGYIVGLSPGTV